MAVKSTEIEIEIGIGLDILASFKLLIELRRLATVFLVAWGVSFEIKIFLRRQTLISLILHHLFNV